MDKLLFPYGRGQIALDLPPGINMRVLTPRDNHPKVDPGRECIRALREPVGSEPLFNMAINKKNAVIMVSDMTRLAPTHLLLPHIIAELIKAGINARDIAVVVAVGAHRKATEEEIKKISGPLINKEVNFMSSSPEPGQCVTLGRTSKGTPVQIFHAVARHELKIATGNIEPHRLAAYSGGAKALMPGCSSHEAIEKNHAISVWGKTGKNPDNNEVRADAEEAAAMAGLDFIFNVVVDRHGGIIRAFAGHPIKAHREACLLAGDVYYVNPGPPADIVVASAGGFPKDQNLYQVVKALQNASAVVKPGGVVILAARCEEGFGNETFRHWVESGYSGAQAIERFSRGFQLGGHKAAYAAEITGKCRVSFVSNIPEEIALSLQFQPYGNLQEAFDAALSAFEGKPEVVAMPYAGLTFPA